MDMKSVFAVIGALFAVMLPAVCHGEISAGYAQDVWNSRGTDAAIIRYDHRPTRIGGQAMHWDGPAGENFSIGLDYDLLSSDRYDLEFGGVYIDNVTDINGTHVNFSIGVGVNLWERVRLQFSHFSNAHRHNNAGWNFLGVMIRI